MSFKIELLDQCPELPKDAPLFGSQSWWDFQKQVWGSQLRCLAVFDGQRLVSWMFFLEIKRLIWKQAVLMPYNPYGGPFFFNHKKQAFHTALHIKENIWTLIFDFLHNQYDQNLHYPLEDYSRCLKSNQWKKIDRYTLTKELIDLTSPNFKWPKTTADMIRRSNKSFTTRSGIHSSWIQHCTNILNHKNVNLYQGQKPIISWAEHHLNLPFIKGCHLIDLQDNVVANFIWAEDIENGRAYALWLGSTLESRKEGAYYQLLDFAFRQAASSVQTFDTCGADHIEISNFKAKFCDKMESRHSICSYSNKLLEKIDQIRNALTKP